MTTSVLPAAAAASAKAAKAGWSAAGGDAGLFALLLASVGGSTGPGAPGAPGAPGVGVGAGEGAGAGGDAGVPGSTSVAGVVGVAGVAGVAGLAGAPGLAGTTPGQASTAPGLAGTTPGKAGTAPGKAGTAPGLAGATPGLSGAVPVPGGSESTAADAGSAGAHQGAGDASAEDAHAAVAVSLAPAEPAKHAEPENSSPISTAPPPVEIGLAAPVTHAAVPVREPAGVPHPQAMAVVNQVAEAVRTHAQGLHNHDGNYRLSMRLKPEALGVVHLDLELRDGEVHLHVHAEEPEARSILHDSAHSLRVELEQGGVSRATVDVSADQRPHQGPHQPFVPVRTGAAADRGDADSQPTGMTSTDSASTRPVEQTDDGPLDLRV